MLFSFQSLTRQQACALYPTGSSLHTVMAALDLAIHVPAHARTGAERDARNQSGHDDLGARSLVHGAVHGGRCLREDRGMRCVSGRGAANRFDGRARHLMARARPQLSHLESGAAARVCLEPAALDHFGPPWAGVGRNRPPKS